MEGVRAEKEKDERRGKEDDPPLTSFCQSLSIDESGRGRESTGSLATTKKKDVRNRTLMHACMLE